MADDSKAEIDKITQTDLSQTDVKPKVRVHRSEPVVEDAHGNFTTAHAVLGLSRLYAVDTNGQVSQNNWEFNVEYLQGPQATAEMPLGPVVVNLGGGNKVKLGAGAAVVLGKPDSGKSLLANTMAALNPELVTVIRFREPEADSLASERALVTVLYKALYESSAQVIFLDSLRTTFYTTSGPTGKGGVNMAIFALLTAYDILARRAGKVIMFALNPMSTDDVAIDYYLEASRGSVSHTLSATAPKSFRISSRSNKTRAWQDVRYEPAAKVEPGRVLPLRSRNHFSVETNFRDDYSIVDLYLVN